MATLYPLRFTEILRDYEFGNRWIAASFEKEGLPERHRLGETWEVCDRPKESSVVKNGPMAGRTLHQLIEELGESLLGSDVVARWGTRFPLLIKLLDASNPLGEQVHPDDAQARELGREDPGKTEAWYMLKARPGATVHCGVRDGVTLDRVRDALVDGTVRDLMEEQPARPGDAFLLHAGTMHCSRGGILFYEIMQNSDITIGLRGREHPPGSEARKAWAAEALKAVRIVAGPSCRIPTVTIDRGGNRVTFIFACRYFALERLDLASPMRLPCAGPRFFVLTQIEGQSTVEGGGRTESLRPGQSCLLPAALGDVRVTPKGPCSLLKAYVPDLAGDVILPLRAAGIPDQRIFGLGGEIAFAGPCCHKARERSWGGGRARRRTSQPSGGSRD